MSVSSNGITLSKMTADDLDFIASIECNADLWSFEESVETSEQNVRERYLKKINEADDNSYDFIVKLTIDHVVIPIGIMQIWSYVSFRNSWEIGFAILPEYGGQGYGKAATALLLQFAFAELNAHKVVGMCNAHNTRSSALMEAIGMSREGIFKEELCWKEQWIDQYFYSILNHEFARDTSTS
ncbi:N-acetyltransferase [Paenibacillaceae bacterium]|nr:N-acetyltransferase [Paenibacillaceae bacterium]